jgi:hypothetical protein
VLVSNHAHLFGVLTACFLPLLLLTKFDANLLLLPLLGTAGLTKLDANLLFLLLGGTATDGAGLVKLVANLLLLMLAGAREVGRGLTGGFGFIASGDGSFAIYKRGKCELIAEIKQEESKLRR